MTRSALLKGHAERTKVSRSMEFLLTKELGRLVKWLRILEFDT